MALIEKQRQHEDTAEGIVTQEKPFPGFELS